MANDKWLHDEYHMKNHHAPKINAASSPPPLTNDNQRPQRIHGIDDDDDDGRNATKTTMTMGAFQPSGN